MSKQYDPALRFQTISEAARTTGLSQYYIRRGCRDGSIPNIRAGSKFMVNVPLLLERMDQLSKAVTSN